MNTRKTVGAIGAVLVAFSVAADRGALAPGRSRAGTDGSMPRTPLPPSRLDKDDVGTVVADAGDLRVLVR